MKSIVLASASPRRKQLMQQAGYIFSVAVSDVDESMFDGLGLDSTKLARKKTQPYLLLGRVFLMPPVDAAAGQKQNLISVQVLRVAI